MEGQQRHILQRLLPLVALAVFTLALWVLVREIRTVSVSEIVAEFRGLSAGVLLASGLLAAASYAVLTLYDFLALQYVGAALNYRKVAPVAFSAFAVGHNVGLASLSGGAIRYRAYSLAGLSASQIALVIAFLPLSYDIGAALLIGITLLLYPGALKIVPLGTTLVQAAGILLLAIPVCYLLWLARRPAPLRIRGWIIRPPTLGIGFSQCALYFADLVVASSVLWVLLNQSVAIGFLPFLAAYLLAIVAGVISNVPGALGVFESALLLLLPDVPVAVLLGSILAYRLIYYLIPLLLALLVIVFRELMEHREKLVVLSERSTAWGSRLAPTSLSAAVFLMGAWLLIGGVIPVAPTLQDSARAGALPLPLLEVAHLLGCGVGLCLLLLSHGIYLRLRAACIAAQALLAVASVVVLIHPGGMAQALIPVLLLALVRVSRREFYRNRSLLEERLDRGWMLAIVIVLAVSAAIGWLIHGHAEYSSRLWWQFTLEGDVSRVLRSSLLLATMLAVVAWLRLVRAGPPAQTLTAAEGLARVKPIVAASSRSSANIALLGDKQLLFHPAGDAVLMYQKSGEYLVALGDPVGEPTRFEELVWSFRELCDANDAHCVFYEVSDTLQPVYIDLGLSFSRLGEEARVRLAPSDPAPDEPSGPDPTTGDAGLEFEVVPAARVPDILDSLGRVSDHWLKANDAHEKGFSLGFFDAAYLANFDCAVLRRRGEIVAFASLWQGADREELSLDLLRYSDIAPQVATDRLFSDTVGWGRANGFRWFSFGMVPPARVEQDDTLWTLWQGVDWQIYRFRESFSSAEELRRYLVKFSPECEPRYLASEGGLHLPDTLMAVAALISRRTASSV